MIIFQVSNSNFFFHVSGTHMDEKAHKCKECEMAFKWNTDLRTHFLKVHQGVKFTCLICGKEFMNQKCQKRHMITVHGALNPGPNQVLPGPPKTTQVHPGGSPKFNQVNPGGSPRSTHLE